MVARNISLSQFDIYHSLNATNMLLFLVNISLKQHARFGENPIETLQERAI